MILYILEKLEELFDSPELKYLFLNTPSAYGNLVQKYLRIAINVFKAAPVQLDSINVFFNLGDSEPIRIIDDWRLNRGLGTGETIYIEDEVVTHKTIVIEDYVRVGCKVYVDEYQ